MTHQDNYFPLKSRILGLGWSWFAATWIPSSWICRWFWPSYDKFNDLAMKGSNGQGWLRAPITNGFNTFSDVISLVELNVGHGSHCDQCCIQLLRVWSVIRGELQTRYGGRLALGVRMDAGWFHVVENWRQMWHVENSRCVVSTSVGWVAFGSAECVDAYGVVSDLTVFTAVWRWD
ncbi:hypothetical protein BC830DRAFT_1156651 [Chytriomyces sp. MP71]|nr:hypothetical protein BC830DRAFT_1156651 [Chytriomyces sp. MP71]